MLLKLIEILFYNLLFKFYILSESSYNDKIIKTIQDNGIVFIKFAQIVSSRNDMKKKMSSDLLKKLSKLQDKCFDYHNWTYLKNIEYLNKEPIAAGSIATVFLINYDNTKCIIKQINYDIKNKLRLSILNLKSLLKYISYISEDNYRNMLDYNEYYNFLLIQTKFDEEAMKQQTFYKIFKDYPNIIIPKVKGYNHDNIIMEYVEGYKYSEFISIYPEYEPECLTLILASMLIMVKNKILHGDLHEGNFLFKINNNREITIIILDFGITCDLSDLQSKHLFNILNPKTKDITDDFKIFIQTFNKHLIVKKDTPIRFKQLFQILEDNNIYLPANFLSFFTTLQTLKLNTDELKKKHSNLNEFMIGYLLENDYL